MEQNKKNTISQEILDFIKSNFLTDKNSQFELTDIKKFYSLLKFLCVSKVLFCVVECKH